jgi:hypothetical protein
MRLFGRLTDKWISYPNLKNHDTPIAVPTGVPPAFVISLQTLPNINNSWLSIHAKRYFPRL